MIEDNEKPNEDPEKNEFDEMMFMMFVPLNPDVVDKTEAYQQTMDLMFEIKMLLSKMCQLKKEENFFSLN